MAAPTAATETIEAVIITGPRKGGFIRVNDDEPALSAEADALLDQAVQAARSMADNAKATRLELEELVREMREARRKRDEFV